MKKTIMGLLLVVMLFTHSATQAFSPCCERWGATGAAAFIKAGAVMVTAFTSSTAALINAFTLEQLTWANGFANWSSEISKQTAQQKNFSESSITVDHNRQFEIVVADAVAQYQPAPMQDQTVTSGLLMAEISDVTTNRIKKDAALWLNKTTLTQSEGSGTFLKRHQKYCDKQGVAVGLCEQAASAGLQNADLNIKTILTPGDGANLTLSDEEREASLAFIEHLTIATPFVIPNTSGDKTAYQVLMNSDRAALSAAALSFHAALAHRTRRHAF